MTTEPLSPHHRAGRDVPAPTRRGSGADTSLPAGVELTRQALRQTADAWECGLGAALDHDEHAARHVMRGAGARRSLLRTADQQLRWSDRATGLATYRRATPSDVVADLTRMNRLLGQLAQATLAGGAVDDHRDRTDVEVARRIGTARLLLFADSLPRTEIGRDYVRSGHELLDALADLAHRAPSRGSAPDVCLALLVALVQTSRHVTRIA